MKIGDKVLCIKEVKFSGLICYKLLNVYTIISPWKQYKIEDKSIAIEDEINSYWFFAKPGKETYPSLPSLPNFTDHFVLIKK